MGKSGHKCKRKKRRQNIHEKKKTEKTQVPIGSREGEENTQVKEEMRLTHENFHQEKVVIIFLPLSQCWGRKTRERATADRSE